MSKKHKKKCRNLNYIEHFLLFISAVNDCVTMSAFASLVDISIGIASFAVGINIYVITAGNKKYKSNINKWKKKHDKIVLLAKTKLNTTKVLINTALIDSNTNHDKFVSLNNILREYNELKETIKNLKLLWNILCKHGWYKQKYVWKKWCRSNIW